MFDLFDLFTKLKSTTDRIYQQFTRSKSYMQKIIVFHSKACMLSIYLNNHFLQSHEISCKRQSLRSPLIIDTNMKHYSYRHKDLTPHLLSILVPETKRIDHLTGFNQID